MERTKDTNKTEKTLLGYVTAACYTCSMVVLAACFYALMMLATSALMSMENGLHMTFTKF
jgi:hypothetical protein